MRIITLETLKNMPNGTVFSEIDKWGNLENGIRILTGRFETVLDLTGKWICTHGWHQTKTENMTFLKCLRMGS